MEKKSILEISRPDNRSKVALVVVAILFAVVLAGCNLVSKNDEPAADVETEKAINVETIVLQGVEATSSIAASGVISGIDEVMVSPKTSGRVVSLSAEEGERVEAGQLLVQLEQDSSLLASYNTAQNSLTNTIAAVNQDINTAELSVSTAEINLETTKIGVAESISSAELTVSAAEITLKNAENSKENASNSNAQVLQNAYESMYNTMQAGLVANKSALAFIGDILGEEPGDITANESYENNLGAKDLTTINTAQKSFATAKESYGSALATFSAISLNSEGKEMETVMTKVKASLDNIRQALNDNGYMLDRSSDFGLSSMVSLYSLKTSNNSYLSSITEVVAAYNSNEQAIKNAKLSSVNSYDSTESNLEAAKNSLAQAEQVLVSTQTQGQAKIDVAQKQLESAQSNLDSIRNQANLQIVAAQGQVSSLAAQLDNSFVRAPIGGVVSSILIETGEMAAAGNPVVKIVNNEDLKVEITLTEFDISKVFVGQTVVIKTAANSERNFNGTVYYVAGIADSTSKMFTVKIKIDDPEKTLKAGIVANVSIIGSAEEDALIIEKTVVFEEGDEFKVYVLENGKVHIKVIEVGEFDRKNYIVTEGLYEGEELILNGTLDLYEGQAVSVNN